MWKPTSTTEKGTATTPISAKPEIAPAQPQSALSVRRPVAEPPQALIGKTVSIKGEVTGSEALHIDGWVEGSINLPGHSLHIGEHANVQATVSANELIIRGKLYGNVTVDDRLEIRTGGTLVGDVIARRITIEDGAYFKGSIDMRREQKNPADAKPAKEEPSVSMERAAVAAVASTAGGDSRL